MLEITQVSQEIDIQQILDLQKENLPKNISKQEAIEQGFLTVQHDFSLLQKMNLLAPSIIAKADGKVVGYCLAMLKDLQDDIPILVPMFQLFSKITYQKKALADYHFLVMGQVCIDKGYRGLGIFDKMYEHFRHCYQNQYEMLVTEVATRNTRSMKAHQRVGFQNIHQYTDDTDTWAVVVWDWK
jgi:ribosomal protein S18 acetylase RimI-like enzyme